MKALAAVNFRLKRYRGKVRKRPGAFNWTGRDDYAEKITKNQVTQDTSIANFRHKTISAS